MGCFFDLNSPGSVCKKFNTSQLGSTQSNRGADMTSISRGNHSDANDAFMRPAS